MILVPQGASCCLRCRRTLTSVDRRMECPHFLPARCSFCGLPLTAQARAQLDAPTRGVRSLDEVCT